MKKAFVTLFQGIDGTPHYYQHSEVVSAEGAKVVFRTEQGKRIASTLPYRIEWED